MGAQEFNLLAWSKNHFVMFILLCIADSDNNIDEEELQEIADHAHLSGDFNAMYHELHLVVRMLPLEYKIDLIAQHKNQFQLSSVEIEDTLSTIEEIILADTSIDREEIATYSKIKKALNG